jgi:hypothetical protein
MKTTRIVVTPFEPVYPPEGGELCAVLKFGNVEILLGHTLIRKLKLDTKVLGEAVSVFSAAIEQLAMEMDSYLDGEIASHHRDGEEYWKYKNELRNPLCPRLCTDFGKNLCRWGNKQELVATRIEDDAFKDEK